MKVLLSTTSGAGHFRPLLPLARALAEAGHELACAAPAEARDMVEREGLRHLPFDGVPPDNAERAAVLAQLPTLPHDEAERLFGTEVFGRLNTTFALPGAQAAVGQYAPDLVVHESAELAVRLAAESAGIRTVAVNPCLSIPAFPAALSAGAAELRAGLGLAVDEQNWLFADETVSWFPPVFDLPDPPGSRIRRFSDPAVSSPTPLGDRDLVYVTLGSEAAQLPFFGMAIRSCVAGALAAGLPVVVSTGREVDLSPLDGLSGDLTVETWVDQDELLKRARVVVCHAGSGTTLGALRAGVPVVAVPLFADQPYNADRIAGTGTGVRANLGPELEAGVAAGVQQLAAGDAAASLDLAAQIAALPPIDNALPWLTG